MQIPIILVLALLAGVFLTACDGAGQTESAGHAGASAPSQFDWQPPDFEATLASGESFNYPASLDGPTIVLFWATWCPYCKSLMPHLQSIYDEYGGEIPVLSINFREDDDPLAYLQERGYDFLLIPEADAIAQSWNVPGTPGLFLVDLNGRAVFTNFAIPESAYVSSQGENTDDMKHYQRAARRAPVWAAELRKAIDRL